MKIEELAETIRSAHKKKIAKALVSLGYFDCSKDSEMSRIGDSEISGGVSEYTERLSDKKGKRIFAGKIIKRVRGWEQYEFAEITEYRSGNNDNDEFQEVSTLLFAKEIEM